MKSNDEITIRTVTELTLELANRNRAEAIALLSNYNVTNVTQLTLSQARSYVRDIEAKLASPEARADAFLSRNWDKPYFGAIAAIKDAFVTGYHEGAKFGGRS